MKLNNHKKIVRNCGLLLFFFISIAFHGGVDFVIFSFLAIITNRIDSDDTTSVDFVTDHPFMFYIHRKMEPVFVGRVIKM